MQMVCILHGCSVFVTDPNYYVFGFRWYIPLRMQSKAQGRILSLFDMERISEDELETQVYQNAKDGLTILSNKLGQFDESRT